MATKEELFGPFAELRGRVATMAQRGALAELEDIYRISIERQDTMPNGRLFSAMLMSWATLENVPEIPSEMPAYLAPYAHRFEEAPSPFTGALYAEALLICAGVARGSAWAHETSEEQWAGFRAALEQTQTVLRAANPEGIDDCAWLSASSEVVKYSGGSQTERDELFERAWRVNYANIRLFGDYMALLLPRWSGKDGAFADKFARRVLAETHEEYGFGGYALAYAAWASYPAVDKEEAQLDLQLMRQGCMDLLERFPDSVTIHNEMARTMSWLDQEDMVKLIFDRGLRLIEEYT